jgi:hypothetical protein
MLRDMVLNLLAATVAWGDRHALDTLGKAIDPVSISYAVPTGRRLRGSLPGYVAPTDWPAAYKSWSTSVSTLRGTLAGGS